MILPSPLTCALMNLNCNCDHDVQTNLPTNRLTWPLAQLQNKQLKNPLPYTLSGTRLLHSGQRVSTAPNSSRSLGIAGVQMPARIRQGPRFGRHQVAPRNWRFSHRTKSCWTHWILLNIEITGCPTCLRLHHFGVKTIFSWAMKAFVSWNVIYC